MSKTLVVAVIDRSGSMASLRDDTIGGFNTFLDQQKDVPGDADLALILFDSVIDVVYDGPLLSAEHLTRDTYSPMGSTALFDALAHADRIIAKSDADKTIVLVQTDGEENASREVTDAQVRGIFARWDSAGIETIFMAANQDALQAQRHLGITRGVAMNYTADKAGTQDVYATMSAATTRARTTTQDTNTP